MLNRATEGSFADNPKRKLISSPTRRCSSCGTGKCYPRRIVVSTFKRKYKTVWKCTNPACRATRA